MPSTHDPFAAAPPQRFEAGSVLIDAVEQPTDAWLITEGLVRQFDILSNGSEFSLNIYKPGAVLSLTWLLGGVANHHYFTAIDTVVVKRIPAALYRTHLQQNPEESFLILERLSRGLDGMFSRLTANSQNNAATRVLNEVRIDSSRFANSPHKLTVAILARRTGLARETVSRAISQLVKDGTLERTESGWRTKG